MCRTVRRAIPSSALEPTIAHWALDLGTCNTALCRWNEELARPELLVLPNICRQPGGDDPLEAPRVVPSATHVLEDPDFWTRLSRRPFFSKRVFWGREAHIGREAVERNLASARPGFVPTFKSWLGRASTAPLTRVGDRSITARDVARLFLRELFAEVHRATGERIRSLVITAPVEAFESYRAELSGICRSLGVEKLTFCDEPVAAALGYGLGVRARRRVLVVDFGAGTLDLAFVEIAGRDVEAGRCTVLAKAGRPVGGDHVDAWLLEHVCRDVGFPTDTNDAFWRKQMMDEARRVKEMTYARGEEVFHLTPPGGQSQRLTSLPETSVDQARLQRVLEEHHLFDTLQGCLDELHEAAARQGMAIDDVDDVLMVGGSTLLPGVYPLFEARFGRDRVRAWRPFEAVAYGATALAAGAFTNTDFIVHDYAILTYDAKTNEPEYLPIVRKGTRFPTRPDQWRQQLVPTCALGEPETLFKLIICELGTATEDERLFGWDAHGKVHTLKGGAKRLVVPLNDTHPTLGTLDPPHPPSDRKPRLDVAFGVNEQRWLIATIRDIKSGRTLLDGTPVVRLL